MPLDKPAISVIIVTYNCERYLPLSVESILSQDFSDLELIVVDNASTDGTKQFLDSIRDPRLVRIVNTKNGGPQAANLALPMARGKYIARLDADDVAMPGRLGRQLQYLETHPEIALCSCEYQEINEIGTAGNRSCGVHDPFEIRWKLGWENFIGHSTIMTRTEAMIEAGGYREDLWCVQDYDLISRIALVSNAFMLPECLVQYRVYPQSITFTRSDELLKTSLLVSKAHLEASLGVTLDGETAIAAVEIMRNRVRQVPTKWREALKLIEKYTCCQARRSPPGTARFIRRETARLLLRYARVHCDANRRKRLLFEQSMIRIFPWQLVTRAYAALSKKRVRAVSVPPM